MVSTGLSNILMLASTGFWLVAYGLIVRLGFKQRTYGMPMTAICLNISWEFIFAFLYFKTPTGAVGILFQAGLVGWFLLDLLIAYTFFKYWKSDYVSFWPIKSVRARFGLLAGLAFVGMLLAVRELGEITAAMYIAYTINLIMSALFITMLIRRGSNRGQSLPIAVCKLLGTLTATVCYQLALPPGSFNYLIYLPTAVLDIAYMVMLTKALHWRSKAIN